jgi:hypothetical protein
MAPPPTPVFVDAAHLGSVGRNITAATTLGMAQHTKRPPPPMSIICRLSSIRMTSNGRNAAPIGNSKPPGNLAVRNRNGKSARL